MDNISTWIPITITGIYTIIYSVTFFIQRAQIRKSESIISSIERFNNIINIDKIESYVKLSEAEADKRAKLFIEDNIENNEKVKKAVFDALSKYTDTLNKDLKDEHGELIVFTLKTLARFSKKDRDEIINSQLSHNKKFMDFAFDESQDKKILHEYMNHKKSGHS